MPNLPRVMLRAPLCVEARTLLLRVGLAAPDVAPLVGARRRHRAGRNWLAHLKRAWICVRQMRPSQCAIWSL
jgi:hypothetical protein